MMLRAVSAVALAAMLASCASGQPRTPRQMIDRALAGSNIAVPGEIVAAELAFARTAREEGQWTAFRRFATDDAVMFVPEPVNARDWLAKQKDPPEAVRWQPHQVWMSCDGSLAVTKGAWQRPDGSFGYFTTVWERQQDGEYKWVLDQGDVLAEPLAAPDIIESKVADCLTGGERADIVADIATAMIDDSMPAGGEYFNQTSRDESLFLNFVVNGSARQWRLMMRQGDALAEVMNGSVKPEAIP
jgi:hypothetical protein